MKNRNFYFGLLLLCISTAVHFVKANVDLVKANDDKEKAVVKFFVPAVPYTCYYSSKLVDLGRVDDEKHQKACKNSITSEAVVFPFVYAGTKWLAETNFVKDRTAHISPVLKENGEFLGAAIVIRAASIASEEGVNGFFNSKNLEDFGKGIICHAIGEGTQKFLMKPAVESVFGPEDSFGKDIANAAGSVLVPGGIALLRYYIQ